jgi:hypothetical protein
MAKRIAKRITKKIKRTKSIKSRSKSRRSRRSRMSKKMRSYKGGMLGRGAPPSYVGSIQGEFINSNGQQLFRNPAGGIA